MRACVREEDGDGDGDKAPAGGGMEAYRDNVAEANCGEGGEGKVEGAEVVWDLRVDVLLRDEDETRCDEEEGEDA